MRFNTVRSKSVMSRRGTREKTLQLTTEEEEEEMRIEAEQRRAQKKARTTGSIAHRIQARRNLSVAESEGDLRRGDVGGSRGEGKETAQSGDERSPEEGKSRESETESELRRLESGSETDKRTAESESEFEKKESESEAGEKLKKAVRVESECEILSDHEKELQEKTKKPKKGSESEESSKSEKSAGEGGEKAEKRKSGGAAVSELEEQKEEEGKTHQEGADEANKGAEGDSAQHQPDGEAPLSFVAARMRKNSMEEKRRRRKMSSLFIPNIPVAIKKEADHQAVTPGHDADMGGEGSSSSGSDSDDSSTSSDEEDSVPKPTESFTRKQVKPRQRRISVSGSDIDLSLRDMKKVYEQHELMQKEAEEQERLERANRKHYNHYPTQALILILDALERWCGLSTDTSTAVEPSTSDASNSTEGQEVGGEKRKEKANLLELLFLEPEDSEEERKKEEEKQEQKEENKQNKEGKKSTRQQNVELLFHIYVHVCHLPINQTNLSAIKKGVKVFRHVFWDWDLKSKVYSQTYLRMVRINL